MSLISSVLMIIGCSNDDSDTVATEEATLSVFSSTYDFGAAGGTEVIEVSSNAVWKLDFDASLWARPSIQSTEGNASVTLTVDANESTDARIMIMTLTSDGVDDVAIEVNQAGVEPTPQEPERPDFIDPNNAEMRNISSVALTAEMGIGWNLGNSLEAIAVNGDDFSGNETSWGNPVITKALIDQVKAAGFNTVRIPISWSHMLEDEATYTISSEWKQRVEEVVNYVLDNDMYAVINVHWDGGWMNDPTYDNQEAINDKLEAFWQQIGVYFRDYDDKLLFAGTNEVHMKDDFNAPTTEYAAVQNSFNQTFINTVRGTGGRNTYRHLIVQAYNTNIDHAVNFLIIPEDPTNDRLMVEVHFYDPYQFSLEENDGAALWGAENAGSPAHAGWGDEDWVDVAFEKMKTNYVDAGYGVILGEFGALLRTNPANTTYEAHVASRNYYLNYVTSAALKNGMVPIYWDNGYTGDNAFGLFNRATAEVVHEDAIQAIISANDED